MGSHASLIISEETIANFIPRLYGARSSFPSRFYATSHLSCVQVLLIWDTVSVVPACRFPVVLDTVA